MEIRNSGRGRCAREKVTEKPNPPARFLPPWTFPFRFSRFALRDFSQGRKNRASAPVIFFSPKRGKGRTASFAFPILLFAIFLQGSCGAPGDPVPPSPLVPVAVSDLAARQAGDGAELVFSLPPKTVSGEKLTAPPAVEIVRGSLKPNGAPDPKSFRMVYTIPGALVANYVGAGHVRFTDPISPAETKAHPGAIYAYLIRTRLSKKRASADSNVVTARLFPVPQAIATVQFQVTENAVNLTWPAPTQTSAGDPLLAFSGYRIYRGEIDPHSSAPTSKDLSTLQWISPLSLLGQPTTNSYRDTQFE